MIPRKDGSVIINCKDASNIKVLKDDIVKKLGKDYSATIPKKINPKIVIFDVCAEDVTDRDAFCDKLVRLNKLGDPSLFTMRVVRLIGRKSNVKVVIEVDPVTFKQIMDKGHVYVGWKRCNVRESFHIITVLQMLQIRTPFKEL
ncbi:hypothetical protein QE152_g31015 [Popillia japonica]|uniref:THUMP domain-containing protein n=1 Tax=Popillia japonica TaxID=7064 RepID=A0AAW1JCQ1_POPJA